MQPLSGYHDNQPDVLYLQQYLRSVILHSLDTFNYKNAEFACERLLALDQPSQSPAYSQHLSSQSSSSSQQHQQQQQREQLQSQQRYNLESVYLYCLTLYRQNRIKSCYRKLVDASNKNIANHLNHLGCSWLYARCCLQLKKYKDGVDQLIRVRGLYDKERRFTIEERFEYEHSFGNNNGSNGSGVNFNNSGGNISGNISVSGNGNGNANSNNNNDSFLKRRSLLSPDASTIYHLLGDLYAATGDVKNSALNYTQCLQLNQFDFEAFQKICKLGVDVRVKSLYKLQTHVSGSSSYGGYGGRSGGVGGGDGAVSPSHQSFHNDVSAKNMATPYNSAGMQQAVSPPTRTPNIHVDEFNYSTPRIITTSVPDAPLRKSNLNSGLHPNNDFANTTGNNTFEFAKPTLTTSSSSSSFFPDNKRRASRAYSKITSRLISQPHTNTHNHHIHHPTETPHKKGLKRNNSLDGANMSTSSTIAAASNVAGTAAAAASASSASAAAPSSSSAIMNPASLPSISYIKELEKVEAYLLNKYSIFAKSFKYFTIYDCYKAIKILEESISESDRNTPWVLSKLGRLHYEVAQYKQSEQYFERLRKIDRTRLEDMEYYSTLLWHLKKKIELTFLANELHDIDAHNAITWCVIGNLFSLNHETEEAIRCFNKAIKLNDTFSYAYTLKGHELFSSDSYETALENFRLSLLHDSRHYNALYGIGMIYMNLGDYPKSEYYFRKAMGINPINHVLVCCVGMIMEKLGKKELALKQYELGCKLQPNNPLPLYKKATVLYTMENFIQAKECLQQLVRTAPDEPTVHFLLGEVLNRMNDRVGALKEFTIAANLDPKGNYLVKEAMEQSSE
ncbi:anaphase-promoting complex subunit cdc27 [Lodderomyces elongisporus]|uniref:anaphase-promoting complex subunit cdc27 n=1 Tax=Lodderomyces elongisporus TaxID=36914 RepID=UPI00291F321A|nr:anaphase-promoting complex subunit cdc27 [Lodderomyces elongisporus]WLF76461.1 anaphase-promoting complex subunit cdc27 [Lodderomyces elongisporus]